MVVELVEKVSTVVGEERKRSLEEDDSSAVAELMRTWLAAWNRMTIAVAAVRNCSY